MKRILFASLLFSSAIYAEVIAYGPGGPAPVLKELATEFEAKKGKKVKIVAGPTGQWINQAKADADIIFAGNSSMMDGFIKAFDGNLDVKNVEVLNIREAGIVVKKGNPKNIKSFKDLLKDNINVMVVDGAGQVGLYEDMALKNGKRNHLLKLRKNIVYYAPNSKMAVDRWNSDDSIDALIIWSHWAKVLGEDKVDFVQAGKDFIIYRAAEIAVTSSTKNKEVAMEFIKFVQSKDAQKVWKKWGWQVK
ncbi:MULTISPECIES: extracellular solute-binding protein [Campylobacter]|uniref:extracellular solute-binding protein n=1 Tax=Campylobacter TaxID=194 RepID=UPI000A34D74B|nr:MULTISPECIES: extracellular solute-binding protein [unclassified Campylobacter]MCR8696932.1 extracellular solute-binding protein [Campylobacter sp. RM19073]